MSKNIAQPSTYLAGVPLEESQREREPSGDKMADETRFSYSLLDCQKLFILFFHASTIYPSDARLHVKHSKPTSSRFMFELLFVDCA